MKPGTPLFLTLSLAYAALGMLSSAIAQDATNYPPDVFMVQPANNSMFPRGVTISLAAEARDRDGLVAGVEFFAGTNSLGLGVRRSGLGTNVWTLLWSNAPAGPHELRARAKDDKGLARLSPPIFITVGEPPRPPQPAVTVRAADAYATEPCDPASLRDPAVFVISRNSGTNIDLPVYFRIGGTASNGVDYAAVPNTVTIPAGRWAVEVPIHPLVDNLAEGSESVVLRIVPPICVAIFPPPPECYLVGQPAEAAAYIRDCPTVTNRVPMVAITRPMNGATFRAPGMIGIAARTIDLNGYVWKVEFLENTNEIGEAIKMFPIAPTNGTEIGFEMVWSNVPPGRYVLRAKATDNLGLTSVSAPIWVAVATNTPPPPTNRAPVLTIAAVDPVAIEGTNCWGWPSITNRFPMGTTNWLSWGTDSRCYWWFTNCGPKNATFVIRRAGSTNDEITVKYAISGTATNGVDYDLLSGVAVIPAGERRSEILVVPKEDTLIERIETVLLKLIPPPLDTNNPPPFIVGYPGRAGAIIVDSARPRPSSSTLPDRTFLVGTEAVDGNWYRVEHSSDLVNWTSVCTNQVIQGIIHFVDPDAQDLEQRFYRAIPEPEPAQE